MNDPKKLNNSLLVCIRHAEAKQNSCDKLRALTERGVLQAKKCAIFLEKDCFDLIITSSATRTKETANIIKRHIAAKPRIKSLDSLYQPKNPQVKQEVFNLLKALKNKPLKTYLEHNKSSFWDAYANAVYNDIFGMIVNGNHRRVLIVGHGNIINSIGLKVDSKANVLLDTYFGYCEGFKIRKNKLVSFVRMGG